MEFTIILQLPFSDPVMLLAIATLLDTLPCCKLIMLPTLLRDLIIGGQVVFFSWRQVVHYIYDKRATKIMFWVGASFYGAQWPLWTRRRRRRRKKEESISLTVEFTQPPTIDRFTFLDKRKCNYFNNILSSNVPFEQKRRKYSSLCEVFTKHVALIFHALFLSAPWESRREM